MAQGRRHRAGADDADLLAVAVEHRAPGARDAAARDEQAPREAARLLGALRREDVLAPERGLVPADGPAGARHVRRELHAQLVPVQRVAHLGAQGVAGAEPAREALEGRHRLDERIPQLERGGGRDDQLVALLPRVAGAAHDGLRAVAVDLRERHVRQVGRQAERGDDLGALGALDRDDRVVLVLVDDLDALGRLLLEAADHLGVVGRVGDEEDVVVGDVVLDEVVDDAAGLLVAAHRVLRLAGADLAQLVREARVDEVGGAGPGDPRLAEVAHVEDPDALTDGRVLAEHSATGVFDRHLPPAEVGHLGPEVGVPGMQR